MPRRGFRCLRFCWFPQAEPSEPKQPCSPSHQLWSLSCRYADIPASTAMWPKLVRRGGLGGRRPGEGCGWDTARGCDAGMRCRKAGVRWTVGGEESEYSRWGFGARDAGQDCSLPRAAPGNEPRSDSGSGSDSGSDSDSHTRKRTGAGGAIRAPPAPEVRQSA